MKRGITASTCLMVFIFAAIVGCKGKSGHHESNDTAAIARNATNVQTPSSQPPPSEGRGGISRVDTLACAVLRDWPASQTSIPGNARRIVQGEDTCVLQLIDTVVALARNGRLGMVYLDTISTVSDGYVSEDLQAIMGPFFHDAGRSLIEYLASSPKSKVMRWLLVLSLRDELADSDDRNKADKGLELLIRNESAGLTLNEQQFAKRLLQDVRAKSEPSPH